MIVISFDTTAGSMRHVQLIAEQQLQRVLAGFELDRRFGLTLAEVQMLRIGRNGRVQGRQLASMIRW